MITPQLLCHMFIGLFKAINRVWKSSSYSRVFFGSHGINIQVGLLAYSCLAGPQFQGDSSLAKILQEQRFNSGDGKFGSAFAQEDGHVFKEESQGNNNRSDIILLLEPVRGFISLM